MEPLKIFDMYSEEDLSLCFNEVFTWDFYNFDEHISDVKERCINDEINENYPLGQTIFGLLLPFDQIPLHINTNSNYLLPVLRMRLEGRIKERNTVT